MNNKYGLQLRFCNCTIGRDKEIIIIMNYSVDYFEKINNGLSNAIVTDDRGNKMQIGEGLELWTERVRNIQQETKGVVFFCGNGASASMAEHMSHDYFQNAKINTTTCAEISHITAISNDISYDEVFSYRVKRILSGKDMLIGISSSGNSLNIVNAVEAAKQNDAFVITLSGMNQDNRIRRMGSLNFYVPLPTYGEVESAHAVLLHCALDHFLDTYMGGRH